MVEPRTHTSDQSSWADARLPGRTPNSNSNTTAPVRNATLAAAALSLFSCQFGPNCTVSSRAFGREEPTPTSLGSVLGSQGPDPATAGTQSPPAEMDFWPTSSTPQSPSPAHPLIGLFVQKKDAVEVSDQQMLRFTTATLPQVPEYRDEYLYAPVRPSPSRNEDAFDAITGIFYDRDRLTTLAAKHGARLLRRYETPREDETISSGFESVTSRARIRLFSSDSVLGPLRTDLRPRNIEDAGNFDIRFKLQWVIQEPSEHSKIFNFVGCTVDNGWDSGTLFMVYQEVRF